MSFTSKLAVVAILDSCQHVKKIIIENDSITIFVRPAFKASDLKGIYGWEITVLPRLVITFNQKLKRVNNDKVDALEAS